MNKIVARFNDGRLLKGQTADFAPGKEVFHVAAAGAAAGTKPEEVSTKDLKALFFVRDLAGRKDHVEANEFDPSRPPPGRRIKVVFRDGETLMGTTAGYQRGRPGFFLVPADVDSNIERCYVVTSSTREISFV